MVFDRFLCAKRVATALLVVASLTASHARADAPSAADKETARTLMKTGDAKLGEGDAEAALAAYEKADLLMGVPTTRLAVGKTQAKLGRLVQARDTLLSMRRLPERDPEPPPFLAAREEAAALAKEVAQRIPSLTIDVTGGTATQILVDGEELAVELTGVARRLNPGQHTISAVGPGGRVDKTINLSEGATERVTLDLGEATSPGAPAPPAPAPVTTTTSPPPTEPDEGGSGISPVTWIGFGIGGAGLVVGAITGGLALSKASSVKDRCDGNLCPRSETEDDYNSALTMAHVSTATLAIGGAGIALGFVGLFALSGDEGSDADVAITEVRLGPGVLQLQGRF